MKIYKVLSILMFIISASFPAMASTGNVDETEIVWKQIYEKNGITGYERSFPGTNIKEFKAVGLIEAKMEVVGEVLRDIQSYPKWMAKCKEARVLKSFDRNTKIFYNEVKVPWPIPNRGVIISNETRYDLNTGRAMITFKAIKNDEQFPVKKGHVQIVDLSGRYLMEFFGRDMTRVTYTHKADPGGKIPVKLANIESRLYPVTNLKGLRKMVKLQKYQDSGLKCQEYDLIEKMLASNETIEKITKKRVNEFILDKSLINIIFEDPALVENIKNNRASFQSIKNLVLDACKIMLKDDRIKILNKNRSLQEILKLDKFFEDMALARQISGDTKFLDLLLNDKDVMKKILTDRNLLGRILDSKWLAKKITNNPKLVSKMLIDKKFTELITEAAPECKSSRDFRSVVKKYIASSKDTEQ